jgi:GNAT superfamily N-acetyltransferase
MALRISPLPEQPGDFDLLVAELNASPHIGEITAAEMQAFIDDETIRFFYDESGLVGFGAWVEVNERWIEVGPFYVMDAYRGHGYGKPVVRHIIEINRGRHQYGITRNPAMKRLFEKNGFHPVSAPPAPVVVSLIERLTLSRLRQWASKFTLEPVYHFVLEPAEGLPPASSPSS